MRFDEYEAVERSFDDAISEIRYEYYDDLEKRQSANGSDTATGEGSAADASSDKFPEGMIACIVTGGNDDRYIFLLRKFAFLETLVTVNYESFLLKSSC
jgi:hypothetical protein